MYNDEIQEDSDMLSDSDGLSDTDSSSVSDSDSLSSILPQVYDQEDPRGIDIVDRYRSKRLSLVAARSLLLHLAHDQSDQTWQGNSYTSKQLTAYRQRYESGARIRAPQEDIILKMDEIRELFENFTLSAMKLSDKFWDYTALGFLVTITAIILYPILSVFAHEMRDSKKSPYQFDRSFWSPIVLMVLAYALMVFIMRSKINKAAVGYEDTLHTLAKILGPCDEQNQMNELINKRADLKPESLFFIFDQIKILHPFLPEEEQAANIESLDRLITNLEKKPALKFGHFI